MIAIPFTRRRPSPRSIDLTAFRLVEPCPPAWDDEHTMPRSSELSLGALLCLASTALVGFVASLLLLKVF